MTNRKQDKLNEEAYYKAWRRATTDSGHWILPEDDESLTEDIMEMLGVGPDEAKSMIAMYLVDRPEVVEEWRAVRKSELDIKEAERRAKRKIEYPEDDSCDHWREFSAR